MTDFAKTKVLAEQIENAAVCIDEESKHTWFVSLMNKVADLENEPLSSAVAETLLYRVAHIPRSFAQTNKPGPWHVQP